MGDDAGRLGHGGHGADAGGPRQRAVRAGDDTEGSHRRIDRHRLEGNGGLADVLDLAEAVDDMSTKLLEYLVGQFQVEADGLTGVHPIGSNPRRYLWTDSVHCMGI